MKAAASRALWRTAAAGSDGVVPLVEEVGGAIWTSPSLSGAFCFAGSWGIVVVLRFEGDGMGLSRPGMGGVGSSSGMPSTARTFEYVSSHSVYQANVMKRPDQSQYYILKSSGEYATHHHPLALAHT